MIRINTETYRSGHNEAHSKCVCPFRARGFESRRLRYKCMVGTNSKTAFK